MNCEGLYPPEHYLPMLEELRKHNKYAKNWIMKIESKTNKHPETGGGSWGWYEIFPLEITVGYWNSSMDDLAQINVEEWNKKAEELSTLSRK